MVAKTERPFLQKAIDVDPLRLWEPAQLELERSTLARTREAGDRAQFEKSWRVGEPLPFGLYEEGDSVMPDIVADGEREGAAVE